MSRRIAPAGKPVLDTDFRYPCFIGERLKPAPSLEILLSYPHQPDEGFQQNPPGNGTTFAGKSFDADSIFLPPPVHLMVK